MQMSRAIDRDRVHLVSVPVPSAEKEFVHTVALFPTLWREKWLIAGGVLTALLIGGFYAYIVATPLYRSTAVLKLAINQDQIVEFQGGAVGHSGDAAEVNSEVEVLRARGVMQQVVERLDLTSDPEFNTALKPQPVLAWFKSWFGFAGSEARLSLEEQEQRVQDTVISQLLEAVTVRNVPLSLVFRVSVESENPRKSALIADTIVDVYILDQIKMKFEFTEQATVWLRERVGALQSKLEEAEAKASRFGAETELVSVDVLRALERQIKDLRERITTAQMNQRIQASQIEALAAAGTRSEQADLSNDVQLRRYLSLAENEPQIVSAFDARLQFILQQNRQDLARLDQQLSALRATETELSGQVSRQSTDLITLKQLTREAEAVRVLYEYFLSRLNETSAQQGIQRADSRILSDAVVPNHPSAPRRTLILAMSAVFGLLCSVGFVLLREARNSSFRTAWDLEAATGYSVLGQIPETGSDVLQYLAEKPRSATAEALRDLRTSLMQLNGGNPPQVILCTSSVAGEGKTTTSLALAQNICGLGRSVLLVEGDVRRRGLSQHFPRLPNRGMTSVLRGELPLSDAVSRPHGCNADVLACEEIDTHPTDFFASDRFRVLMEDARRTYDTVIIDTPPVLLVPDARVIAEHADAILFTVQWDKTTRRQVEEAMRMFQNAGQRIAGLVLSQICEGRMKSYGNGDVCRDVSGYGAEYQRATVERQIITT